MVPTNNYHWLWPLEISTGNSARNSWSHFPALPASTWLRPGRRADLRRKSEKLETAPFAVPEHSAAKKASPHARDRKGSRPHRDPMCGHPSRRVRHGGDADSETSASLE